MSPRLMPSKLLTNSEYLLNHIRKCLNHVIILPQLNGSTKCKAENRIVNSNFKSWATKNGAINWNNSLPQTKTTLTNKF